TRFCRQNCINALYDYLHRYPQSKKFSFRDSIMAENIKNLADIYPGEKLAIWAANIHLAKSVSSVNDPDYNYTIIPAGYFLHKHFKDSYYFVAFTQNFGRGGARLFSYKFKKAESGSIEYLIDRETSA